MTAYDCSDPIEVQAYSSIPERPCSTQSTPVEKQCPVRLQLLQQEKKNYFTGYFCSLRKTDIRYNCGIYGHSELDPIHWSFAVPHRVSAKQCLNWLSTSKYRPAKFSTAMDGQDLEQEISLEEPNHVQYLAHGKKFNKAGLPHEYMYETATKESSLSTGPKNPSTTSLPFMIKC